MRRLAAVAALLGMIVLAAPAAADMPSGRTTYRALGDYDAELSQLAVRHPGVARMVALPHRTLEGRAVKALEIAGNVNGSDGRPVLVILGLQHGDEWPSGELALEFAHDLLAGYGRNDRVTPLLDALRVVVVPVVNPDGFALSRSAAAEDPLMQTFATKRRNCRVTDGRTPSPGECGDRDNRDRGVDLDRNFGVFWGGSGASGEPTAETYRGAAPFSEPEAMNVRDLVSVRQPVALVATHATGGSVLRPPGLRAEGSAPDEVLLKAVGDAMAAASGAQSLATWERAEASGTAEDWSYFTAGALSFAVEATVQDSQPPYDEVIDAYVPTRDAYMSAALAAADAATHSLLTGRAPEGTVLRLAKDVETPSSVPGSVVRDTLGSTIAVGPTGRFSWHITPSTRPFATRERRISGVAPTPAKRVPVTSPAPTPPNRALTYEIEVAPEARRQLRAEISGADGDDYDLVLYAGSVSDANRIASSAGAGAEETIVVDQPAPGRYVLEVRNAGALSGYEGSLAVFGEQPGTETVLPASEETWTLTCETRDGAVVARRKLDIRRGQRKDLGQACRSTAAAPARLDLAITTRRTQPSRAVGRSGLRVQATCSRECEFAAVASAGKTVVARSAVTRFAGRRIVRLRVTSAGARLIRRHRSLELVVTGVARDRLGTVTARTARVTLRR